MMKHCIWRTTILKRTHMGRATYGTTTIQFEEKQWGIIVSATTMGVSNVMGAYIDLQFSSDSNLAGYRLS